MKKKRILSMFLILCMVLSTQQGAVYASVTNGMSDIICENHREHDEDCGYAKTAEKGSCTHLNEDGSYSCAPDWEEEKSASPSNATPGNAAEKGYICSHDDDCEYMDAELGSDCKHECDLCRKDEGDLQEKCTCKVLCTDSRQNLLCPICGADDGDFAGCGGRAAFSMRSGSIEIAQTLDLASSTSPSSCKDAPISHTHQEPYCFTWDKDKKVLNLNNINIKIPDGKGPGIVLPSGVVEITATGESEVIGNNDRIPVPGQSANSYGIKFNDRDNSSLIFSIEDTSILKVSSVNGGGDSYRSCGITFDNQLGTSIIIESGTLEVTGGGADNTGTGLDAPSAAVTVKSGATLIAKGGTVNAAHYGWSYGMDVKAVDIQGGTVNARGGQSPSTENNYGIRATGDILVSGGGQLTAEAEEAVMGSRGSSKGIYAGGSLHVTDGDVVVSASASGDSYGVDAENVIVSGDSTIKADSADCMENSYGIFAKTDISVTDNGKIEAKSGDVQGSVGSNNIKNCGVSAGGSITVSDEGILSAVSGKISSSASGNLFGNVLSAGIYTTDLMLSGSGNITAVGNDADGTLQKSSATSAGIYWSGKLKIYGGKLEAACGEVKAVDASTKAQVLNPAFSSLEPDFGVPSGFAIPAEIKASDSLTGDMEPFSVSQWKTYKRISSKPYETKTIKTAIVLDSAAPQTCKSVPWHIHPDGNTASCFEWNGTVLTLNGLEQDLLNFDKALTLPAEAVITLAAGSKNHIVSEDSTILGKGDLTINGTGTLTANGKSSIDANHAISVKGNLLLDEATVTAAKASGQTEQSGIAADGRITIQNHAKVDTEGSYGIKGSDIFLKSGSLSAKGLNETAIQGSTTLSGGKVTAAAPIGKQPFSNEPVTENDMKHKEGTGTWDNVSGTACVYEPFVKDEGSGDSGGSGDTGDSGDNGDTGDTNKPHDSSSDDSSDSGTFNTNIIVIPPSKGTPNAPTQSEIGLRGSVDKTGSISVNVTEAIVVEAINKALTEAGKNGSQGNGINLVFNVNTGSSSAGTVAVNLPKNVQEKVIEAKIVNTVVKIEHSGVRIGMDLAAITDIHRQADSDVTLQVTRQDSQVLGGSAKDAVGDRPLYTLRASSSDGKILQRIGAGGITVAIPYTVSVAENINNIQAVCVDETGNIQWIKTSVYDSEEKTLNLRADRFASYGAGYQSIPTFTDISGHWGEEAIMFAAGRGLLTGTGENAYSPDNGMTRAEFIEALGRLSGVETGSLGKGIPYTLDPSGFISREEIALIVTNYAEIAGCPLHKLYAEHTFSDGEAISPWAKDGVKQAQMAGIVNERSENKFQGQTDVTRAEGADVLKRLAAFMAGSR